MTGVLTNQTLTAGEQSRVASQIRTRPKLMDVSQLMGHLCFEIAEKVFTNTEVSAGIQAV